VKRILSIDTHFLLLCQKGAGCKGGHPYYSLTYTAAQGVSDATKYSYNATKNACQKKKYKSIYKNLGTVCGNMELKDQEDVLVQVFAYYGPFIVTISESPEFRNFKSTGIFKSTTCSQDVKKGTRFLVVVGYGTDGTEPYWLVRGSFGTGWGDKGYAKIVSLI